MWPFQADKRKKYKKYNRLQIFIPIRRARVIAGIDPWGISLLPGGCRPGIRGAGGYFWALIRPEVRTPIIIMISLNMPSAASTTAITAVAKAAAWP